MRKHDEQAHNALGRTKDEAGDACHQLWLIYVQLKDAESDAERRLELLERSREELGRVLNSMTRQCNPDW
jgi:hypothetical protein